MSSHSSSMQNSAVAKQATSDARSVSKSQSRSNKIFEIPELFPSSALNLPQQKMDNAALNETPIISTSRALSKMKVEEKLAVIYAFLNTDDVDRAEILFNRCLRDNSKELLRSINTDFVNQFIDLQLQAQRRKNVANASETESVSFDPMLMDCGYEQRALDWLKRFKEFNLSPSEDTFAILCHHYLCVGDSAKALHYIHELQLIGIEATKLLENDRFCDPEERMLLETLLRSLSSDDSNSAVLSADELLLSALGDASDASDAKCTSKLESVEELGSADGDSEQIRLEKSRELVSSGAIGVDVLKKALSGLSDVSDMEKYKQQIWLEERSHMAALEQHEIFLKNLPAPLRQLSSIPKTLINDWQKQLTPVIINELQTLDKVSPEFEDGQILPFLKLIKPEKLALITISEFLRSPSSLHLKKNDEFARLANVKAVILASAIGNSLEREHNIDQLKLKKNQKWVPLSSFIFFYELF